MFWDSDFCKWFRHEPFPKKNRMSATRSWKGLVAEPLTEIGVQKHPRAEVAADAGLGADNRGGWARVVAHIQVFAENRMSATPSGPNPR